MKIKIYDYANNARECDVSDKDISSIVVEIVSGDEVILVIYEDGTIQEFDSSNNRSMDFNDGLYIVSGDLIDKWIAFDPPQNGTVSYSRQEAFAIQGALYDTD